MDNQDGVRLDDIILLVNNTSDDTATVARLVSINAATRATCYRQQSGASGADQAPLRAPAGRVRGGLGRAFGMQA